MRKLHEGYQVVAICVTLVWPCERASVLCLWGAAESKPGLGWLFKGHCATFTDFAEKTELRCPSAHTDVQRTWTRCSDAPLDFCQTITSSDSSSYISSAIRQATSTLAFIFTFIWSRTVFTLALWKMKKCNKRFDSLYLHTATAQCVPMATRPAGLPPTWHLSDVIVLAWFRKTFSAPQTHTHFVRTVCVCAA